VITRFTPLSIYVLNLNIGIGLGLSIDYRLFMRSRPGKDSGRLDQLTSGQLFYRRPSRSRVEVRHELGRRRACDG
jgi:hypothetical protein